MDELDSRAFDKPNVFNTGNNTAGGNATGQFDQEEFYRNFSKVGQITLQQILVGSTGFEADRRLDSFLVPSSKPSCRASSSCRCE